MGCGENFFCKLPSSSAHKIADWEWGLYIKMRDIHKNWLYTPGLRSNQNNLIHRYPDWEVTSACTRENNLCAKLLHFTPIFTCIVLVQKSLNIVIVAPVYKNLCQTTPLYLGYFANGIHTYFGKTKNNSYLLQYIIGVMNLYAKNTLKYTLKNFNRVVLHKWQRVKKYLRKFWKIGLSPVWTRVWTGQAFMGQAGTNRSK